MGVDYQSYQSGIETVKASNRDVFPVATNRTNLELKLNKLSWNKSVSIFYQSYQSGIETTERVKNRNGRFTTNRTNLELKHGSGG